MNIKCNAKRIKVLLSVFVCLAVLLCCNACSASQRLYVGFFANLTHAPALVSADEGYIESFFDGKAKVERFVFNAGPSLMEALRSGKLDVGYVGPIPAINGYISTNGEIKIIAGVSVGGCMLVAAQNSNVKDISSLDGKTVAVPQFNNTQDILLRQILAQNGLCPTSAGGTVEIVQQDNSNIGNLLQNNSIDAALVPEPWGSRFVLQGVANVLLDSNEILDGNYPVAVLVARTDYVNSNRAMLTELLKEHISIVSCFDECDLQASNRLVERITGVSIEEDVLLSSYNKIKFDYNVNAESLQVLADACYDLGIVDTKTDVKDIIDSSILNEVLLKNRD